MFRTNIYFRTVAALLAIGGCLAAEARPPENQTFDPATSEWYRSLKKPNLNNASCCDYADCRPTEFRKSPTDPTLWQAFISKELYGQHAPDDWMNVPPEVILDHHENPTGRIVICWYRDQIWCAVLPSLT